jgi:hypothetical protein
VPGVTPVKNVLGEYGALYAEKGFSVVPVDMRPGERNKRPLLKFGGDRRPLSAASVTKLADRHPYAGIALNVGYSDLVLVDIDSTDPEVAREVFARFGSTDVKARTPGGGWHGWYSHSGGSVRTTNLRSGPESLPVDIKAGNQLGIVPPTVNPEKQGVYRPERLSQSEFIEALSHAPQIDVSGIFQSGRIQEGYRNDHAMKQWRCMAHHAPTWKAYLANALAYNEGHFDPPWSASEVEKQCKYWWKKKQAGELMLPGGGWKAQISLAEIEPLLSAKHGQVLALWMFVRTNMPLDAELVVCPEALARTHPNLGTRNTIRKARKTLEELGYLKLVHRGGSEKGDPNKYVFGSFPRGQLLTPIEVIPSPPLVGSTSSIAA